MSRRDGQEPAGQGREHLKQRLTRRGLADSSGMFATGFPATAAKATLPASLTRGTIRLAIGRAAAWPAPVSVAILLKEALRAMVRNKWRSVVSMLFAVVIVSIGWRILMPMGQQPEAVAAPASDKPNAKPAGDLEAILGTWIRVSTDAVEEVKTIKMVVTKDPDPARAGIPPGAARFVFEWRPEGHGSYGQKVLLDPTQAPKTIDFLSDQPGAPKVCLGIYRLEGDTLTICFRAFVAARPEGFVAVKPGEILDVYRREKSKATLPAGPVAPAAAPATPSTIGKDVDHSVASINGHWIVRGAYGNALALLNIDVQGPLPLVSLLAADSPTIYKLQESKIENLRIDDNSIRFEIKLVSDRNPAGSSFAVDAYLPEGNAEPKVLPGSISVLRLGSRSSWSGPT